VDQLVNELDALLEGEAAGCVGGGGGRTGRGHAMSLSFLRFVSMLTIHEKPTRIPRSPLAKRSSG
jgi:hypothetical protein